MGVHLGVHSAILGVVSAIVSLLQTWSVQRFGPIYGGVIGTVPIIIMPASIVLSIDETETHFVEILYCVPLGVLLNIVLLLAWRIIPMSVIFRIQHKTLRMIVMIVGSILAWAAMATAMRFAIIGLEKLGVLVHIPALIAFAVQVVVAMLLTVFGRSFSAKVEGKVKWKLYLIAGALGLITGVALVFLSEADDVAGGLLMAFPVIVIASVSSLASTYAETFPLTATTAMIGGSVATSMYAIIFAELLPVFDRIFMKRTKTEKQAYAPSAIAVTTILTWFSCLLLVSLPLLFVLRLLARREKSGIEKVRWTEEDRGATSLPVAGSPSLDPSHSLVQDWSKFKFEDDDDDDDDGLGLGETTSLLSRDSLARQTVRSQSENAARRAILEESVADETPLIFSSVQMIGALSPSAPTSPGQRSGSTSGHSS